VHPFDSAQAQTCTPTFDKIKVPVTLSACTGDCCLAFGQLGQGFNFFNEHSLIAEEGGSSTLNFTDEYYDNFALSNGGSGLMGPLGSGGCIVKSGSFRGGAMSISMDCGTVHPFDSAQAQTCTPTFDKFDPSAISAAKPLAPPRIIEAAVAVLLFVVIQWCDQWFVRSHIYCSTRPDIDSLKATANGMATVSPSVMELSTKLLGLLPQWDPQQLSPDGGARN
jgi:hypothetical protein